MCYFILQNSQSSLSDLETGIFNSIVVLLVYILENFSVLIQDDLGHSMKASSISMVLINHFFHA